LDVIIVPSHEGLAELGANLITQLLIEKPSAVLGLATGSTPIAIYQRLIKSYQAGELSFKEVTTFNLDEYYGMSPEDKRSYSAFMRRELFDHIDIDMNNTHLPHCSSNHNSKEVGDHYERLITMSGGIDLQVLGIGSNSHIGFNEPGSSMSSRTRLETLAASTLADNRRFFEVQEDQPQLAMTMGIGTILESKHALLVASGKRKARAVKQAIEGPLSSQYPASSLQLHQRVTCIIDEEAAGYLSDAPYVRSCAS
jgi:glucosamine-6-phosphate deaminase